MVLIFIRLAQLFSVLDDPTKRRVFPVARFENVGPVPSEGPRYQWMNNSARLTTPGRIGTRGMTVASFEKFPLLKWDLSRL
jgi:hypothetical protein